MLTPSQTAPRAASAAATTLLSSHPSWLPQLPPNSPLAPLMSPTPKSQAGLCMSLAMALHFFGYEFARGSNMALFTSSTLGFGSAAGKYYPLAMACVSPASMVLLLGYGRQLEQKGPRKALRNTTLLCILALGFSGAAVALMQGSIAMASSNIAVTDMATLMVGRWTLSQLVVAASFVFQNSYAHLLYAQQWSFLGSIFTPTQASKYYSYVAGLSSICSMVAGASIHSFVGWIGLPGLQTVAALSLMCTLVLADWAYSLSEKHGFDPSIEMKRRKRQKEDERVQQLKENTNTTTNTATLTKAKSNTLLHQLQSGTTLFRRVPTLGALFCETLTFQSLSTILNTCLVTQLKDAVPNDAHRAAWTGNFYACVNGLSTIFQFLLFPLLTQRVEPKVIWRLMPLLPLLCAIVQCLPIGMLPTIMTSMPSSALYLVAISFLTAKTMDYSLRNVLAELVYVPLDFESRFVGKEVIAVFANRFGKSGMALLLSGLQFVRGSGGGGGLSGIALVASLSWWASAVRLSSLVLAKEEAELVVAERMENAKENDDDDERVKKES